MAQSDTQQGQGRVPLQIPMIGPLPVHLAVTEIVELFVTSLTIHHQETSNKFQSTALSVRIKTIGMNTGGDQAWFCVRVKCSDEAFQYKKINLDDIMPVFGMCIAKIAGTMQKMFPGEFLWTESFKTEAGRLLIWHRVVGEEFIQRREERESNGLFSKNPHEISVCWKVVQSKEHMVTECQAMWKYLHLLKLFSPQWLIQFHLNVWGAVSSTTFEWKSHKATLGYKKMSTDIQHFMEDSKIPENVPRIFPKMGLGYSMTGLKELNLKLSAVAAIIPPLESDVIDQQTLILRCRELKVLFFGPFNIPLLTTTKPGICPSTVLKLEDYGLKISKVTSATDSQNQVEGELSYQLKPLDEEWQDTLLEWDDQTEEKKDDDPKYSLYLFIHFNVKCDENCTLISSLSALDDLRQGFVQCLCKNRTKVRKATSSALDKVLTNVNKAIRKQDLVSIAIKTISKSVSSILDQSENMSFKVKCCQILGANSVEEVKSATKQKLWEVSAKCYGVSTPFMSAKPNKNNKKATKRKLKPSQDTDNPKENKILNATTSKANNNNSLHKSAELSPFMDIVNFSHELDQVTTSDITQCLELRHEDPIASMNLELQKTPDVTDLDSLLEGNWEHYIYDNDLPDLSSKGCTTAGLSTIDQSSWNDLANLTENDSPEGSSKMCCNSNSLANNSKKNTSYDPFLTQCFEEYMDESLPF